MTEVYTGPVDYILDEYEDIECGKCITTKYFYDNTLVRQDVKIEVDPDKAKFTTKGTVSL